MANSLSNIMPKILARGLMALRSRAILPRLVNGSYKSDAASKGSTIDVPIPTAVAAQSVVPGVVPITAVDTTPGLVQVALDQWKQNAPIHLTDDELVQIDKNKDFLPMQLGEAIEGLASGVNQYIMGKYKDTDLGVYGYCGTAATTPFASTVAAATAARKVLNQQKCPKQNRRGVLDYDAEANALALSPFSDAEKVMSAVVKMEGEIGRKFGIDWTADDDIPTHTAGTLVDGGAARTMAIDLGAGYAIGLDTVALDEGAATTAVGTIVLGDIISFANHSQTYTVIANTGCTEYSAGVYTCATNVIDALKFYPALKAALVDNEVMTVKATHVVNLAFHRDAFAFATRPLVSNTVDLSLGSSILSMSDPQTGLVLRLEVSRQHKQVCWEFDILYGAKLVRPELAVRIAG